LSEYDDQLCVKIELGQTTPFVNFLKMFLTPSWKTVDLYKTK